MVNSERSDGDDQIKVGGRDGGIGRGELCDVESSK